MAAAEEPIEAESVEDSPPEAGIVEALAADARGSLFDGFQPAPSPVRATHRQQAASHTQWRSFADGCEFVKRGLWVELGGFAAAVAFFELAALSRAGMLKAGAYREVTQGCLLVSLVTLLAAATLSGVARVKLQSASPGGILVGALAMTCLRALVLGIGLLLTILGMIEKAPSGRAALVGWSVWLWFTAVLAGLAGDLCATYAMARAGRAIPNDALSRQAATTGYVTLLVGAVWLVIVGYLVAAATLVEASAQPVSQSSPARPTNPRGRGTSSEIGLIVAYIVPLALLTMQGVYTYVQHMLYESGRRARANTEPL